MKHTKLSVVLMASAIAVSGLFTSCNKKLKDDIKDLDKEIEDLKAQNATLQSQADATADLFGYPFTMTLTTKNNNDSTIVTTKSYEYGFEAYYNYMKKQPDGTWYFQLYAAENANDDVESYLEGYYNPTTGAITQGYIRYEYNDYAFNKFYIYFYESDPEASLAFTVNKFDTSTGFIDLSIVCSTTTASGNNIYANKAMSGTFSVKSKLGVFLQ